MRIVAISPFLNEDALLPRFLDSLDAQSRRPDRLLLVDDGSTDGSAEIAMRFCADRDFAALLRRPLRPAEFDRLAAAAELRAFHWAVDRLDEPYDLIVKMDTDLELTPSLFAELERKFLDNPDLGVAGAFLSVRSQNGALVRERCPAHHVRGATKFYRRRCFEEIQPVLPLLGWDTVDEVKARMHGWQTRSYALAGGDPVHLRPSGSYDGALRAYRRWGRCAYGYGSAPLYTVLASLSHCLRRPLALGGVNYMWGWFAACLARRPRAAADVRRFLRREQRRALLAALMPAMK